jgi:hypothetical protein
VCPFSETAPGSGGVRAFSAAPRLGPSYNKQQANFNNLVRQMALADFTRLFV